ncbi:MAG: ExeA family protein, partial [Thermodesulforhabdaceae bacterium]
MYLDYYGLRQKPFEGTPDPSFFYYSKAHKEALAAMQYGVEQNKGLILISGDVGTGKTTLIHTYLKNLDPSVLPVYIDYPFVSMSQLLKYLAE